jgi:hypothetical protein
VNINQNISNTEIIQKFNQNNLKNSIVKCKKKEIKETLKVEDLKEEQNIFIL